ncbi:Cytokinesis protein sepH [Cyphellophora attinorum]|uniref:non-specific serine/threonine protein kinase n=1 Tax=Cyphellophora attinorum TaxID=1664694 RepID=A0A0N1HL45_9EURO|nr:Cytokinesis protein sepH [Phialophora attinorum]KPI37627.1 Cytokinesis protein sepH [Phialophora attinorum]
MPGRTIPAQDASNEAQPKPAKTPGSPTKRKEDQATNMTELKDYQLGDCIGKGAFGSVYRALNWSTGETVAIKQIKLADLPKSELRMIMLEIDVLKNLDHANIVKYHGSVKTPDTLNIILEYCENGSLNSITKNFGRFPENLVAVYMAQVLQGLVYLHEQGVMHRDIKGANILTTKQGLVKLADFGVASTTAGLNESSVVGTPYWMAPEVIELAGATTKSDIWSVGCTVIELLDGRPPYHQLQAMPALFRIVNDDHPPLPQGASPLVIDFLMQCFQKDPNLRVTARKLLKHPFIMSAKKAESVVSKNVTDYTEAVKSVQEWNEALKDSPEGGLHRKNSRASAGSPLPMPSKTATKGQGNGTRTPADRFRALEDSNDDVWDNDFPTAITSNPLKFPQLRQKDQPGTQTRTEMTTPGAGVSSVGRDNDAEDKDSTLRAVKSKPSSQSMAPPASTARRPASPTKTPARGHARHKSEVPKQATELAKSKATPAKPAVELQPTRLFRENSVEDFSDLIEANEGSLDKKLSRMKLNDDGPSKILESPTVTDLMQSMKPPVKPGGSLKRPPAPRGRISMRRTRSSIEIQRYAENEDDEDFSDVFSQPSAVAKRSDSGESNELMLSSKISNLSWLPDDEESDEDDPFAELEEGLPEVDLESNIARDKQARLRADVEMLVGQLKVSQDDDALLHISEELMNCFSLFSETKSIIISAHGVLPMLEILEDCKRLDVVLNLLKIINAIIHNDEEVQENVCFVGGIPKINKFASNKFPKEIRLEAAAFVRQMYQTSTLILQMFVSAGGLTVLVDFLEDDYDDDRELVLIGVNGIWSVFELQAPRHGTTSAGFFRGILFSNREQQELAELCEGRIASIFFIFSQAENYVKELVAKRTILYRVMKAIKRMSPTHQITMLKFTKNLSMLSTTLEALHNSNAIDVLTDLLTNGVDGPHAREMSNQILSTVYNLCRLSKGRQEDAALAGIIPVLMRIVKQDKTPVKEFALPILCDMAHSTRAARRELWQNKGLVFYISLLSDPYWQVTALDAIFAWLQEETSKVEDHLLENQKFTTAIITSLTSSKSTSFENLLEPLQKLLRLSPALAASVAQSQQLWNIIQQKMSHNKPAIRLNLLRIIGSVCDASIDGISILDQCGLYDLIEQLQYSDPAILVRSMAGELLRSWEDNDTASIHSGHAGSNNQASAPGRKHPGLMRRTSSGATPPHLLERQMSMPTSPQLGRAERASMSTFYDQPPPTAISTPRRRQNGVSYLSGASGVRPVSRDGSAASYIRDGSPAYGVGSNMPVLQRAQTSGVASEMTVNKPRLPRQNSTIGAPSRLSRQSTRDSLINASRDSGSSTPVTLTPVSEARERRREARGAAAASVAASRAGGGAAGQHSSHGQHQQSSSSASSTHTNGTGSNGTTATKPVEVTIARRNTARRVVGDQDSRDRWS